MREIKASQIVVFLVLFAACGSAAVFCTFAIVDRLELGGYRPLVVLALATVLLYAFALLAFRTFLRLCPLPTGEIAAGSRAEFVYHVYLLFFLVLFYPVIRSGAAPVPLTRLLYQALGARLGRNTYSSGIILDPVFVTIGANTLIGQYALIIPHVIEGEKLAHYRVTIGSNVTIGAGACVLSGTTIGDGAIVATGAVVPKGTVIGPNERWGGVPARRLDVPSARKVAA